MTASNAQNTNDVMEKLTLKALEIFFVVQYPDIVVCQDSGMLANRGGICSSYRQLTGKVYSFTVSRA